MKITDLQAIPVRIPLKKEFTIAVGTLTHTNHVLVRMTDEDGHVGWGETTTFHSLYGYDQHMLAYVLQEYLIPAVMGMAPHDLALMHKRMDEAISKKMMAKTGIDLSAHDLIAQAAGLPCFLGGCIETTPGTAAALHFYAATDNMVSAAEIFGSMFYEDDLTTAPFTVENGSIALPNESGPGVSIDMEKVEKYRVDI